MKFTIPIFIGLMCWSLGGVGQKPDFEIEDFFVVQNPRSIPSQADNELSASAWLYSDGSYLSLVIEVRDPVVKIRRDASYTDHIDVWFALPQSAYPNDFEYNLHPNYIYSEGAYDPVARKVEPRFFSLLSEYGSDIAPLPYISEYDYPSNRRIAKDSLWVPDPKRLKTDVIHYGIVQYSFFPDGRPAELKNYRELGLVEDALGVTIGDIENGITYSADFMDQDEGYIINAQFSPQALGFISLPYMDRVRMMVDLKDTGNGNNRAHTVRSSTDRGEPGKPSTFNLVNLNEPLYTNVTQIPNEMFEYANHYPIFLYGDTGWIPTYVDIDALAFQENRASNMLTEVKFCRQPFHFYEFTYGDVPVESLKIDLDYVNEIPREREYLMVDDFLITTDRTRFINADSITPITDQFFFFPDGEMGLISKENSTIDPYGWGLNGTCVEESISIHRINDWGKEDIVYIQQGNGPNGYCEIGEHAFSNFYISQIDWVKEGQIMVLRLNHQTMPDNKRVKISWEDDGSNVEIVIVD